MNDFAEAAATIAGEDLLTHYVLIAEVMTSEGLDLRLMTSDSLTAWTAIGMLRVATDMIADMSDSDNVTGDDDDSDR